MISNIAVSNSYRTKKRTIIQLTLLLYRLNQNFPLCALKQVILLQLLIFHVHIDSVKV